jgi:hypothetical protein
MRDRLLNETPYFDRRMKVRVAGQQDLAGVRERAEQRLVQQLIAQAAFGAFDEGILLRLAGRNVVPLDLPVRDQRSIVMLVNSVPLSDTIMAEQPRMAITASSSRATRRPGSQVSATRAKHTRVKSSTMARMRKRRPSVNASDRKSRLGPKFGLAAKSDGL